MKRIIPLLALIAVLAVPSIASATGTHPPTITPPPPVKPCPCCQDLSNRIDQLELVFNQKIEALNQRIVNLENTVTNLQNQIIQINQRIDVIINTPDPLACTSGRIYRFTLRKDVQGVAIARVDSVLVAGTEARGSFSRTSAGRFRIRADYRGVTAPAGQLRTITVNARLADGRKVRLVQFARLCLERDGNPNDTPAQGRANR